MSWFRRDRSSTESGDHGDETTAGAPGGAGPADDTPSGPAEGSGTGSAGSGSAGSGSAGTGRDGGPFDVEEAHGDVPRVDLGALRLPARVGMELRLEVEDATKRVIAATVALQGSTLQLQAFAAPRTAGIWAEVREEIRTSVSGQGGTTEERDGPFGTELLARLPARTADGRTAHRAVRFVGVDGPRWFLRGVLSGPAAVQEDAAAALEEVLRGVIVVRGSDAMPPRELLALTMPPQAPASREAPQQSADGPGPDAGEGASLRPRLAPPERGPEITETR
jgi:hypothetical protein